MDSDKQTATIVKSDNNVSVGGKISYGIYFFGQNLIYWMITSHLMFFYTDIVKILPIAVIALTVVSKVWDAVNDPIFGNIIDNSHPSKGKFLPWIKYGTLLLPIATMLMFVITPGMADWLKIVLAFVTYLIWDTLYTVSDVPIFALTTTMTDSVKERSKLISYGRFAAAAGGAFLSMILVPMLGNEKLGSWSFLVVAAIIAVLSYLTMLPVMFTAKERFVTNIPKKEKSNIKEMFTYIKGNRFLLIFFMAFCVNGIFGIALGDYVATWCFGGMDFWFMNTLVSMPPAIIIYIVMPFLLKKFDKMQMYITCSIVNIAFAIALFFIGYKNPTVYFVFTALKSFSSTITGILMFTFAADCVEYGHYVTGIRKEGITFSLQTFSAKFTSAIAMALTATMLLLIGYNADIDKQTAAAAAQASNLWLANCLIPLFGNVISLPILFAYKLRDKDIQVMALANDGTITREEAETKLSRKYS